MPGRYFLTTPLADVAAEFGATLEAPDPGPRRDAAPGEMIAAIWDVWKNPSGTEIASLATATVVPSADVAPIHHRMTAILDPEERAVWLGEAEGDPEACLRTYPNKRLKVKEAGADLR